MTDNSTCCHVTCGTYKVTLADNDKCVWRTKLLQIQCAIRLATLTDGLVSLLLYLPRHSEG